MTNQNMLIIGTRLFDCVCSVFPSSNLAIRLDDGNCGHAFYFSVVLIPGSLYLSFYCCTSKKPRSTERNFVVQRTMTIKSPNLKAH